MKLKLLTSSILSLTLIGCGDRVSIDTGNIGKVLGTGGLEDITRTEGSFRLDSCYFSACERVSILQAYENTVSVEGEYYISHDKLNLGLTVEVQYAVRRDKASRDEVYKRVKSSKTDDKNYLVITTERVFSTYIRPSVKNTIRSALNNYNLDSIMDNISIVSDFVEEAVQVSMEGTPIIVNSVTFSVINYPEVITSRRVEAASVDAEKITKLKRIEADFEVLKKKRSLMIEEAKIAVEADSIVSKSMSPKMASWLFLSAFRGCVEKESGCNITIHPSLIPMLNNK